MIPYNYSSYSFVIAVTGENTVPNIAKAFAKKILKEKCVHMCVSVGII